MSKQIHPPLRAGRRGLILVVIVLALVVAGSGAAFALASSHKGKTTLIKSTPAPASVADTGPTTAQALVATTPQTSPTTQVLTLAVTAKNPRQMIIDASASAIVAAATLSPASPVQATAAALQKVVCIDPGHQAHPDLTLEPIGPGSKEMKPKVEAGTRGVVTGVPESQLVLTIALKLRAVLEAHGVKVVMTRTTQNVDISNSQRAQIANAAHANLFVRIHANGNSDESIHGSEVLYPSSIKGWTDTIAAPSKRAASLAEQDLVAATGARNLGLVARGDITGFNWSKVPVILPEVGFMTNPNEDRLMETSAYQTKIVGTLAQAILTFIGVR